MADRKNSGQNLQTSREIAESLKARIGYDTTQSDLAKEFGISSSYLSEFLAGRKQAGPTILKKLGFDPTPVYRRLPEKGKS